MFTWGGTVNRKLEKRASMLSIPGLVTPLQSKIIKAISCGDFHTLALQDNGTVFSWGGGASTFNRG